jgi:hypothetical protein
VGKALKGTIQSSINGSCTWEDDGEAAKAGCLCAATNQHLQAHMLDACDAGMNTGAL